MDKVPSNIPDFQFDAGRLVNSEYKDSAKNEVGIALTDVKGMKYPPLQNITNACDAFPLDNHSPNDTAIVKCGKHDKPISVHDVLSALKKQLTKVDFHELAGKEPDDTLRDYEYQSLIVKSVLALSEKSATDFVKVKDSELVYLYNGAYWEITSNDDLNCFLKDCAELMGINELKAMSPTFRDNLLKSFHKNLPLFTILIESDSIKINLQNGTFEINARKQETKILPFTPDDYLTYQLSFDYDPDATCPVWQKHLDKVLPDKSAQLVLAEFFASAFIPSSVLKLEKMLMLYGQGSNGKSVIYNVINTLFGEKNVSNYSISQLTDTNGYYRAGIKDKLLNYSSELAKEFESAVFKQMVSGEEITARSPYEKPFTFRCKTKFIVNANVFPRVNEHTYALFRRFIIIPFDIQIPESEQIKDLDTQIISSELSGVFNWVLEGLHRLLKQKGFTDCTASKKMLDKFRKDSDTALLFLDEKGYEKHPKEYIFLQTLYDEYKVYCFEAGYRFPLGRNQFSERLRNVGYTVTRVGKGFRVFVHQKPFEADAK